MKGRTLLYALAAALFYVLVSYYMDVPGLKSKLAKARGELVVLKRNAAEVERLKQQIKQLEAMLPELKKVLPERAELGKIVETFSSFASEAGLQIKEIDTSSIVARGPLYEWKVKLKLIAPSYVAFLRFVEKAKQLERNFIPEIVRIDYIPASPKNPVPKLSIYLELKTYLKPSRG